MWCMAVTGLSRAAWKDGHEGGDGGHGRDEEHSSHHRAERDREREVLLHEEHLDALRHRQVRGVEAGGDAPPGSAPVTVPANPSRPASRRNSSSTFRRCIPIARRVPISRVRSRIAMASVFRIPITTMTSRMKMRMPVMPRMADRIQERKAARPPRWSRPASAPPSPPRSPWRRASPSTAADRVHHAPAGLARGRSGASPPPAAPAWGPSGRGGWRPWCGRSSW